VVEAGDYASITDSVRQVLEWIKQTRAGKSVL
jgi:hypothetical protein